MRASKTILNIITKRWGGERSIINEVIIAPPSTSPKAFRGIKEAHQAGNPLFKGYLINAIRDELMALGEHPI